MARHRDLVREFLGVIVGILGADHLEHGGSIADRIGGLRFAQLAGNAHFLDDLVELRV